MKSLFIALLAVASFLHCSATIHFLALREETRLNIPLTDFGYDNGGTLDFSVHNFTVPEAVVDFKDAMADRKTEKFGMIGFTLSRGNAIHDGIRTNPHVCQLLNTDQGLDALFFVFDFSKERLTVSRSGAVSDLKLCPSIADCPEELPNPNATTTKEPDSMLKRIFGNILPSDNAIPYQDYIPLSVNGTKYAAHFATRFLGPLKGEYQLVYHNCLNYKSANGVTDRIAVDFAVRITEMNAHSYLSAGDIPKPQIYFYLAFLFAMATIAWMHKLCRSDPDMVFRVHKLMTALVFLKTLSVFFHGMNYYYAAAYGHQQELWAVIFYITHLLKGALLFGTIILIGSGYTLFKNFLSDRDRNIFMIVLPLQIIDNIIMAIIEESEFGEQRYYFWTEVFMFFDFVCCMAIILPVLGSIRHLQEGARTDGKAAFNVEKLRLFRHFYVIVIAFIYLTRFAKFMFDQSLPFNLKWVSVAIVESATFVFFVMVGYMFRPTKQNPYLKLSMDSNHDDEEAVALTTNGLYENVSRVQRITVTDEVDDIPGMIGGYDSDEDDRDTTTLLKTHRESSIL
uniref:Lung seven transmembrane receptor family protein n=3 Tax=Panagrellus redivivus TaxID=6233 RepID=A0A7E4UM24_PANRE